MHESLVMFFSKMRQHERFDELKGASGVLWEDNRPGKRARKELIADDDEEDEQPNFMAFTEMMGV